MSTNERPREVAQYVFCMRVLGVMYACGALLFFFLSDAVFYIVNFAPKFLKVFEVIPASSEQFWLPLATSMMVMLTFLAFSAAADPHNRPLAWVHVLSKICSSAGYAFLFLTKAHYFAYLVGVITDFPIFLFVLWLTLRCGRALTRKAPAAPAAE